jgi:hypothetical protein
LAEFGRPRRLIRSGGWILEREIPGSALRDAMGCYPLFSCRNWEGLAADLQELESSLISLVLVTDPFGAYDPSLLERTFNRGAAPFKRHQVVALGRPAEQIASPDHRRKARRASGRMTVERLEDPTRFLDDWVSLYEWLIRRHGIRGINAFSRAAFARQFAVPGLVAFRAVSDGVTLGMLLWYIHGEVGYYHLGASSPEGYERNASFALFWHSIEWFTDKLAWLDLGAGAGCGDGTDGLDRFKRGWATGTRTAYLCRHVFQPDRYTEIVRARGTQASAYFPAYRSGEFAA